jgi:hypothetical protein
LLWKQTYRRGTGIVNLTQLQPSFIPSLSTNSSTLRPCFQQHFSFTFDNLQFKNTTHCN